MKHIFNQLVGLHGGIDASCKLSLIQDYLVPDPILKKPFWNSYIPFVGPKYEEGGVLLVGTAQSLAKLARKEDASAEWLVATGMPNHSIYRLYRIEETAVDRPLTEAEVSFKAIAIQPYMDGIFAGIAGAALMSVYGERHLNLNAVTQRIAVTNFFKHSLQTPEGNDLNPLNLPKEAKEKYFDVVLRDYMLQEIEILKPQVIVAFNEKVADRIRASWRGGCVYGIYDPASIKRGNLLKGFAEQVSKASLRGDDRELLLNYVAQMNQPYRVGKAVAAETYLAKYYCDFQEEYKKNGGRIAGRPKRQE